LAYTTLDGLLAVFLYNNYKPQSLACGVSLSNGVMLHMRVKLHSPTPGPRAVAVSLLTVIAHGQQLQCDMHHGSTI